VPRNQGGSDDISNLQSLCFRCNAAKRDGCLPTQEVAPTSAACRPATPAARRVACSARWRPAAGYSWRKFWKLCIADADPVTPGHSLVIPRRHGSDGLAVHQPEWNAEVELGVAAEMKVIYERGTGLTCHLNQYPDKGPGSHISRSMTSIPSTRCAQEQNRQRIAKCSFANL
jgi:hypothetical protein